jgi:hypothetical protein
LSPASLQGNDITTAGAQALGTLCPDSIKVVLDEGGPLNRAFAEERNKAKLIRQFGATPLKRYRLYVCGFGGAQQLGVCAGMLVLSCFFAHVMITVGRGGQDNACGVAGARLVGFLLAIVGRRRDQCGSEQPRGSYGGTHTRRRRAAALDPRRRRVLALGLCRAGGGKQAADACARLYIHVCLRVCVQGYWVGSLSRCVLLLRSVTQYYAGHELFLDGSGAVFVVVVRLDVDPQESARQLWHWLRFIKSRMPEKPEKESRPMVLVVGSHRDAAGVAARSQEGGNEWMSAWGNEQLRKVRLRVESVCECVCVYVCVCVFVCVVPLCVFTFAAIASVLQLQESRFGVWLAFDPHFYVIDCRLSRDSEMDRLKASLVACHTALSLRVAAAPKVCSTLLDKLKELRKRHMHGPIITVGELLQSIVSFPISLPAAHGSICR